MDSHSTSCLLYRKVSVAFLRYWISLKIDCHRHEGFEEGPNSYVFVVFTVKVSWNAGQRIVQGCLGRFLQGLLKL